MPSDLFDLAARISAETSQYDRAIAESQKKIQNLAKEHQVLDSKASSAFKNIASAASSVQSPISGVTTQLQNLSNAASAAGPVGAVVMGLVAITTAAAAAGKAILDLSISTAQWQDHLGDISAQVGISVETLSALEVVAKSTGTSLDGITASLGIFQRNLEEAQVPGSKMAETLKSLGVESNNTEEAFREAISGLAKMDEGYQQTAKSMELFGRGGKSILAIAKETGGNLDAMIAKLKEMGLVLSKEDAKAANDFTNQMDLLQFQFRAASALIVKDVMPQILSAVKQISQVLNENRDAIGAVGSAVSILARGQIGPLVTALQTLQLAIKGVRDTWLAVKAALAGIIVGRIDIIMTIFQMFKRQADTLSSLGTSEAGMQGESMFGGVQSGVYVPSGGGGGGGRRRGGGGGGGGESAGQRLLNQLTDEYNQKIAKKLEFDRMDLLALELQKKEYQGMNPILEALIKTRAGQIKELEDEEKAQKANIEANQGYLDVMMKIRDGMNRTAAERMDIESKMKDAVLDAREALDQLTNGEDTALEAAMKFIAKQVELMEATGGATEEFKKQAAELIRLKAAYDELVAERNVGKFMREAGTKAEEESTRAWEDYLKGIDDAQQEQMDKARQIANDLTYIIDNALHVGFRDGMKAGIIEFAQGILRMIETKILDKLSNAIAEAIWAGINKGSSGSGGQGGGGWGGIIMNLVGGLFGGLFGGGGAKLPVRSTPWNLIPGIPHAGGLSYVPYDNYPALLHKGERVVPASENKSHPNVVFNVYAQDAQSFGSRETQRQISEKYRRAMARTALTA